MKLRSKLIATVVSMCAAIAVMGVGVWASTSDNFTVTVKNDVDIQIIKVDADVWGEYAVFTNMKESDTGAGRSTTMANRTLGTGESDVTQGITDTRYVLYTHYAQGYNDGLDRQYASGDHDETQVHPVPSPSNTDKSWDSYTTIASSGLGNYLTGANNTYLDSGKTDNNIEHRDTNVDTSSTVMQVVFMYTVRQYESGKPGSGVAGLNNIKFTLTDVLSEAYNTKLGKSAETVFSANYFVAKSTPSATATKWTEVTPADNGTATFTVTSSAAGATAGDNDNIINIMCVYTLLRGSANIDLSGLYDAFGHTLTLDSVGTTASTDLGEATVDLTWNAATPATVLSKLTTLNTTFARITAAPNATALPSIFGTSGADTLGDVNPALGNGKATVAPITGGNIPTTY